MRYTFPFLPEKLLGDVKLLLNPAIVTAASSLQMKLVIDLLMLLYCTVKVQTEPGSIVVAYLAIQLGHSKCSWPFMQPGSFSKGIAEREKSVAVVRRARSCSMQINRL